jgi:hypothetical protein
MASTCQAGSVSITALKPTGWLPWDASCLLPATPSQRMLVTLMARAGTAGLSGCVDAYNLVVPFSVDRETTASFEGRKRS